LRNRSIRRGGRKRKPPAASATLVSSPAVDPPLDPDTRARTIAIGMIQMNRKKLDRRSSFRSG
jgi:hypothetical protein